MRAIDSLKILLAPVLPSTSQKIHEFFNYEEPLFGSPVVEELGVAQDKHQVLRYQPNQAESLGKDRWKPSELEAEREFRQAEPLYKLLEPLES
jgi:methionyl-tRNA synthetase